jgi:hypothetical protein
MERFIKQFMPVVTRDPQIIWLSVSVSQSVPLGPKDQQAVAKVMAACFLSSAFLRVS